VNRYDAGGSTWFHVHYEATWAIEATSLNLAIYLGQLGISPHAHEAKLNPPVI
jgi:hypothetical protein